jgi:hypothetical protein
MQSIGYLFDADVVDIDIQDRRYFSNPDNFTFFINLLHIDLDFG